jgi:two-component system response regulator AdeR
MDQASDSSSGVRAPGDAASSAGKLILVVEDEPTISRVVVTYLQREGYRTEVARDGRRASQYVHTLKPDLVILDVMLPERSGLDVLRRMREESDTPVILLTARSEEIDRILGFELGADDYVTKPFSARELMSRVRAVLRRSGSTSAGTARRPLRLAGLELDPERMTVAFEGGSIDVTPTEFRLLACLLEQPGRVFRRDDLLEAALPDSDALERVVDSHFRNLRKKLPDVVRIEPVRGVGYRLTVAPVP